MTDLLYCYGCTKHYRSDSPGRMVMDAQGNKRWCCEPCALAKQRAAKVNKN